MEKGVITQDVYNIYNEFSRILKEERLLHNIILKYIQNINYNSIEKFLEELDDLNEDTITYYYRLLDEIEDACDTRCKWSAIREKKQFRLLTDEYRKKLCALIIT